MEKTTFLFPRTFALFTLRILLNAVIYCLQLNTRWLLRRHLEGGLLVIDVVGLRSMYFVVMPRVNLIVILMTYDTDQRDPKGVWPNLSRRSIETAR
jgi:hypothetical protein